VPQASLPSIGSAYAQTQTVQRPVGFADIVEKVKPAVISVRVKMNAGPRVTSFNNNENSPLRPGSPMERFFRRFGLPDDALPNEGGRGPGNPGGRNMVTGQGSGFFISNDGYAVTNTTWLTRPRWSRSRPTKARPTPPR